MSDGAQVAVGTCARCGVRARLDWLGHEFRMPHHRSPRFGDECIDSFREPLDVAFEPSREPEPCPELLDREHEILGAARAVVAAEAALRACKERTAALRSDLIAGEEELVRLSRDYNVAVATFAAAFKQDGGADGLRPSRLPSDRMVGDDNHME